MAQVFSRGTLTRSRWDFFEGSDAWGCATGLIGNTSGNAGYLYNNGSGPGQLDIYYASVSFAFTTAFAWLLVGPAATFGIGSAGLATVHAVQADGPTPLGICQIANLAGPNVFTQYRVREDPNTFDQLTFNVEGPFLSLPPGYALAVQSASADINGSVTFLYQSVVDIAAPAV